MMKIEIWARPEAWVLTLSLVSTAHLAHGQERTAAAANEPAGLEEVTVTGRYTVENLQATPLAITAVSGDQLQARKIDNVTDLGRAVPNLYITPGDANEGI